MDYTNATSVQYHFSPIDPHVANGSVTAFTSHSLLHHRTQYIHRVLLTNLQPATEYVYRCGGPPPLAAWSTQYRFSTGRIGSETAVRLAIYGDMGVEGAYTLPQLNADTAAGMYDAIIHVGDFAYDMYEKLGRQGDEFMRRIEPMAATVPYMVCPGNHEQHQWVALLVLSTNSFETFNLWNTNKNCTFCTQTAHLPGIQNKT